MEAQTAGQPTDEAEAVLRTNVPPIAVHITKMARQFVTIEPIPRSSSVDRNLRVLATVNRFFH
jgi:hypothetical protein